MSSGPWMPSREAGVVLDVGGDHQLAHRDVAGDHEWLEVRARRVDGGGQAGRPGADDGDAPMALVGLRLVRAAGRGWDGGGHWRSVYVSIPPRPDESADLGRIAVRPPEAEDPQPSPTRCSTDVPRPMLTAVRRRLPLGARADAAELLDSGRLSLTEVEANLADLARLNRLPGGTAPASPASGDCSVRATAPVSSTWEPDAATCRSPSRPRAGRRWRSTRIPTSSPSRAASSAAVGSRSSRLTSRTLPFDDGAFDVAHASLLLHHLDPAGGGRRPPRAAPGGAPRRRHQRSAPRPAAAGSPPPSASRPRPQPRHAQRRLASARRAYTLDELDALLAQAGLATALAIGRVDATGRHRGIVDDARRRARRRSRSGRLGAGGRTGARRRDASCSSRRAHHPRPKACAEYASPRIVEELAAHRPATGRLVHATPCRLAGMQLVAGGRAARIGYADREGPRDRMGRRPAGLRRACWPAMPSPAGRDLREGTRLVRLSTRWRARHGAMLRTADGTQTRVAADLADRGRRRALDGGAAGSGVERPVRFPRRLGLVAHYEGIDALTDHGEMHVGPRLLRRPGADAGRRAQRRHGAADGRRGRRPSERFDAAIAGLPAVAERLRGSAAPDRHPRRGPDRSPRRRRRRARLAADRRRGRVRRPVHRRGDPPRAALRPRGRRRHPRRRRSGRRLPGRAAPGIRRQGRPHVAGPGLAGRAAAARARRARASTRGRRPRCASDRRSATAVPATDALSPRALLEVLAP